MNHVTVRWLRISITGAALLTAQNQSPVITPAGVVDAASFRRELAPGSLVSIFGTSLAAGTAQAEGFPLPTVLDGVAVELEDGAGVQQAPLLLVSPNQINAQMPYYGAGAELSVRVRNAAGVSNTERVKLATAAPAVFTGAEGRPLVLHADYSLVTAESPADAGEPLILYLTGLGAVDPPLPAGHSGGDGGAGGPLNQAAETVRVRVAGEPAPVYYSGLAPGFAGLYQLNFALPVAVDSGLQDLAVEADVGRSQPELRVNVLSRAPPRQYWVAPDGSPAGDGSPAQPWDLKTALSPGRLKPGDTAWLLSGVYGDGGTIESRAAGTPQRPVVIRQAGGHRATINGGLAIHGRYAVYWGFEVTNINPDRGPSREVPTCINTYDGSVGVKLINLVLHDCNQGIGFWAGAENAEAYGNIIYHNGFQGDSRGHGHGIYTQNRSGTKVIADNIIFNQFGMGIQAYGSSDASVEGYQVEGNIVFNNGSISNNGNNVDNLLFAIGLPMSRIRIENNYTYHTPETNKGYSRLGWALSDAANRDVVVRRNYWIGGQSSVELWNWASVAFTENTCYSNNALDTILSLRPEQSTGPYSWDRNTYYGAGKFRFGTQNHDWNEWRQLTGLDGASRFIPGRPSGTWSFVRPNKYEPGRAHIAIYNWSRTDAVNVDPAGALEPGQEYEVRDAQDFFGEPVAEGVYQGGSISIPMKGRQPVAPRGTVPSPPSHTCPEFGAFVLLKK